MIAGTDPKTNTPNLFWIDHLSSMQKMNYAAHGYASYFCMSTMDRYWHPDLTRPEAIQLLKKCIHELKVRFVGNFPAFVVKVIDSQGIKTIDL
jgi:20S proteasome subunit beta 4